jgi:predicted MFS family arabinose efflux permease
MISGLANMSATSVVTILLVFGLFALFGVVLGGATYSLLGRWPTVGIWAVLVAQLAWSLRDLERDAAVFLSAGFGVFLIPFLAVVLGRRPTILRMKRR